MPRDGSNVYHRPSGIDAVTNTTISSTAYNLNVQDVETDLNTPRPIVAGGTGATSASAALTNLGGEQAKQLVTNYDATVFQAGSFYSATSATGSPVAGHAFNGICYVTDANNMTIEARDVTTGTKYVRQMTAEVWGSWVQDPTTSYVDTSIANKAVRYDTSQGLTSADIVGTPSQTTQGRQNVYAAPFDAMGWSGMQVNGSMEVSQELGATGSAVSGSTTKYIVDGWRIQNVGSQVVSARQGSPTNLGYSTTLQVTVTTANASPAAGNYLLLAQPIEGYRVSRLAWGTVNARPITIGFWIYANRPGPYSGAVLNGASNRSYPFTFTINAATTFEYKTITVPGDTTGTWPIDNSNALQIIIAMMVGTTYQGTAGAWAAGTFLGATGSTNGVAATTDIMALTGVVVLPGIEAPSVARAPMIMRPYDQELLTCRRYYQTLGLPLAGFNFSATAALFAVQFNPIMRAVPTFSYSALTDFNHAITGTNPTAIVMDVPSNVLTGGRMQCTFSGLTANQGTLLQGANGILKFDARL